jgi:hypothetical protein
VRMAVRANLVTYWGGGGVHDGKQYASHGGHFVEGWRRMGLVY